MGRVVPHQANVRIIDTRAKRLKLPEEKGFINIQRYGNMSAATAPVAFVEAIEKGRVGADLVLPHLAAA